MLFSLRIPPFRLLLILPLFAAIGIAQATAANLEGRWHNDEIGNTWVFQGNTGEFIQKKSINGNPGIVTIYFDWSLSSDETSLTYHQTKISLTGSAGYDREQDLDKTFTTPITITNGYIALGGNKYWKQ